MSFPDSNSGDHWSNDPKHQDIPRDFRVTDTAHPAAWCEADPENLPTLPAMHGTIISTICTRIVAAESALQPKLKDATAVPPEAIRQFTLAREALYCAEQALELVAETLRG